MCLGIHVTVHGPSLWFMRKSKQTLLEMSLPQGPGALSAGAIAPATPDTPETVPLGPSKLDAIDAKRR